jgi:hypothetical protein
LLQPKRRFTPARAVLGFLSLFFLKRVLGFLVEEKKTFS